MSQQITSILASVAIVTFFFAIFFFTHLKRKPKKREQFVIKRSNMKLDLSIDDYLSEIDRFFRGLNYHKDHDDKVITYTPRNILSLKTEPFKVVRGHLDIELDGPSDTLSILLSHLDLIKIFN